MRLKSRQVVELTIISILALLLPGQNAYQRLRFAPREPVLREVQAVSMALPPVPVKKQAASKLWLNAKGVIAVDVNSGAVLYSQNPDLELLPASTTKIMTTLVSLDEYDLDEIITIDNAYLSIGHTAELEPEEQLTVGDLLKAMMIPSGNDAALALGQHHPDGYSQFVTLMNQKAQDLHLTHTNFRNVSGVESYGHNSTARDLAILTKEAMKNTVFRDIVSTQHTTITSVDGTVFHSLVNLNELLGTVEGVKGVKTGWTENAGECLVTFTQRNGRAVIAVVLGSQDRFGDSRRLIEWTFDTYDWVDAESLL